MQLHPKWAQWTRPAPRCSGLMAAAALTVGLAIASGGTATAAAGIPAAPAGQATPPPTAGSPSTGSTSELKLVPAGSSGLELRSGASTLARITLTTPALRRGDPRVRELEVDGHRIAEVRLPVRGRAAEEVWVGDIGTKPARVIWSGVAGPRDVDEEAAMFVEVTPERIFEYQTAAQVSRCDGQPVRLFTRAWDFGSGRFRPILSTVPPPAPATQALKAERGAAGMPTARPKGGFHFTAASTTAAAGNDARALLAPTALEDGDPRTIWAEGLGGDGRGEFLTARATSGQYRVRGLRIVPGDASSPGAFKARNRIKSLFVAFGPQPERRFEVEFPEDPQAEATKFRTPYWIALPRPVDANCATIVVREVYRGTEAAGAAGGGGTTAISDLEIFTELDDASGVQRLVTDVAAGANCSSRVPLLAALGEPAVVPSAQAIVTGSATGIGRECLVEALTRIEATSRNPTAVNALATALVGATANEERLIHDLIQKTEQNGGMAPVPTLAALLVPHQGARNGTARGDTTGTPGPTQKLAQASPADRARAARLLGDLQGAEAAAALLAAAGAGEPETRLAVVQALGRSPGVTLAAVIAAIETARGGKGEGDGRREADLIRVLPALARRAPAERPSAVASLRRSLAGSAPFEVRARAILALGELGDAALAPELSAIREKSDDAVLRFLAARELGSLGGQPALLALRGALADADPRVRETAAQGLGFHKDSASEAVLIEAAKAEPWPFARRAQIEALSRTCGAPARELLTRAMQRDVDEVRRASLVGLVRCRDGQARPTLLATLKNRRASAPLRELSGALLGELGDRSVTPELAQILSGLVNEAEADLAIEGVAIAALRSLAHLGGPAAANAAARLAADARHPAYQRLALESLGRICDPDVGAKALAAARAGTNAALAAEAQKAEQRCR